MGISDCEEGKRLLKAAAQPNSASSEREAFLEHINRCHLCNAGGIASCHKRTSHSSETLQRMLSMRGAHGPKLRDTPGRVLYGTEERPPTKTDNRTMRQFEPLGRHFGWRLAGECVLLHCLQVSAQ